MKWSSLVSVKRQCPKAEKPVQFQKQFAEDEFDDDFLSIISSQAFRRLQDKTQVFPLDKSDFVRTRLTHSIEVSTIGRQLAGMITQNHGKFLQADFKNNPLLPHQIQTIAACAGLLHDTGNPPFGHYGEEVIRGWFSRKFADPAFRFRDRPVGELLNEQMRKDFEHFEGNAQGLRIMAKNRLKENSHDINLTYSVMNTLIKYPNPSTDFDPGSADVKKHKLGYYYAEQDILQDICKTTGTLVDGEYCRHPIVYIMEAADDIAYATADLADSMIKRCFTLDEFINFYETQAEEILVRRMEAFRELQPEPAIRGKIGQYIEMHRAMKAEARKGKKYRDQDRLKAIDMERRALFESEEEQRILEELETLKSASKGASRQIKSLTAKLQNIERSQENEFVCFENWLEEVRMWLMYGAAYGFSKNYDAIMEGTFPGDLFSGTYSEDTLSILKKAMSHYVYDSPDLIRLELSAKKIVETLLENFVSAVMYYGEEDEKEHLTIIEDRFIHMIPGNFVEDYKGARARVEASGRPDAAAEKLYLRFLMVTDYISGMTDSYAKELYQTVSGLD